MTNIVCRKVIMDGNLVVLDTKAGMRKAGNEINNYLANPNKPRRGVFKRVFKKLTENDAFDFAVRTSAGEFSLKNVNNKYRKFETYRTVGMDGKWQNLSEDEKSLYKIVVAVDEEDGDADDDFFKMHIAVPATPQDLIMNGYIGNVVADIEALYDDKIDDIIANNSVVGTATEKVKKYLLATVFLSRCH